MQRTHARVLQRCGSGIKPAILLAQCRDTFVITTCCSGRPGESRLDVHPCSAEISVVARTADDGGLPITGQRDRIPLERVADGADTDEFRSLGPHPVRAREHPRRADISAVTRPTDDGGFPITGKRDRKALQYRGA